MITDSVPLSWFLSHGWLVGGNGWSNTEYYGRQITKYVDVEQKVASYVTVGTKRPKKITLDENKMVELGGEFEKVGGGDEALGDEKQKVG